MKRSIHILARVYALLLNLYPRAYQVEYGEELETVFNLAANEVAQRGGFSVIWMSLRELRDLPGAIILEHRRERRKQEMTTERGSLLNFEPGSWREAMAALAPFLLFGVFPTFLDYLRLSTIGPKWLEIVLALSLLGSLLSLFVIGVVKGFPRWFLPYVGLPLTLFSVYIFSDLVSSLRNVLIMPADPWFLVQFAYQGQLWIGLLAAGLFVVLITRTLPPWRPFYWRLRRDWTLLSFIMYGATLFALLFTFDDYVNEEPYKIVAMLLLAAGGCFYLRGAHAWQRLLALFTGLTLAMIVAAAGKVILNSSQNWPYPRDFTWHTEVICTVIIWGWLVVVILTPVLLNLLPRPDKHPVSILFRSSG